MIQAVAEDEERGALGMHYTSLPNKAGAIMGDVIWKHDQAVRIVIDERGLGRDWLRPWMWSRQGSAHVSLPGGVTYQIAELPLLIELLQDAERQAYERGLLGWPRGLREADDDAVAV
jgi:hypothetical protein